MAFMQTGAGGDAGLLLHAHTLRMAGQYEEAIKSYNRLLDQGPHDTALALSAARVEAACGLARCDLETGHYDLARHALEDVGKEGTRSDVWQRTMAEFLGSVGRYQEAIVHAKRAVELDADDLWARYELGLLQERVGRREEAIETYRFFDGLMMRQLPRRAAALTATANGFLRYSILTRHRNLSNRIVHTLQELYQPAYERLDRTYWPARLAAADLLRSKFQLEQATQDYQAALEINKNLAAAHVGLGWLALDRWDFEETDRRIALAKSCNPNSVAAFQLQAALRLTEHRFAQARAAADLALKINPNDVTSLGYAAAAANGLNDPESVQRFSKRAYDVTPRPSAFHRIMGDYLAGLRQYEASREQYELAIKTDPTDPHPRTELGLMYMQWGKEQEARRTLDAAWELDDFDARTFNSLNLLDELSSFARYETEHFSIRYDASKDAILGPCFAGYLESIYNELCDDYEWTPTDKTVIEFMPTHRMFGVRITGKPWIHTVGACTGRVIALDSPRSSPELNGPYNVANVLRHEFTHTVTLAATQNRIAHWFTEGLAVLQEDRPRSFAWRHLLAEAVRRDELFTLRSIDWGFIRPRRANDRQLAYAQSEWMCEFIIDRFGYDALNRMIKAFRDHKPQGEVFKEVLAMEPGRFDIAFADWAGAQAQSWGFNLSKPDDPIELGRMLDRNDDDAELYGRLARAEFDRGNMERALVAARHGLAVDANNVLSLTMFGKVLWSIRLAERDPKTRRTLDDELAPAMKRLLHLAHNVPVASKVLATIALDSKSYDDAIKHFTRLKRLSPMDPVSSRGLAGIYLDQSDYDRALPHLLHLAPTQEHDPEVASTIALIYARKDRLSESRYWYTQALYINPFNTETHEALVAVLMRMDDHPAALKEYEILCTLKPKTVRYFEEAATAFHKFGDYEAARRYARQAVKLDPYTRVRSLLDDTDPPVK